MKKEEEDSIPAAEMPQHNHQQAQAGGSNENDGNRQPPLDWDDSAIQELPLEDDEDNNHNKEDNENENTHLPVFVSRIPSVYRRFIRQRPSHSNDEEEEEDYRRRSSATDAAEDVAATAAGAMSSSRHDGTSARVRLVRRNFSDVSGVMSALERAGVGGDAADKRESDASLSDVGMIEIADVEHIFQDDDNDNGAWEDIPQQHQQQQTKSNNLSATTMDSAILDEIQEEHSQRSFESDAKEQQDIKNNSKDSDDDIESSDESNKEEDMEEVSISDDNGDESIDKAEVEEQNVRRTMFVALIYATGFPFLIGLCAPLFGYLMCCFSKANNEINNATPDAAGALPMQDGTEWTHATHASNAGGGAAGVPPTPPGVEAAVQEMSIHAGQSAAQAVGDGTSKAVAAASGSGGGPMDQLSQALAGSSTTAQAAAAVAAGAAIAVASVAVAVGMAPDATNSTAATNDNNHNDTGLVNVTTLPNGTVVDNSNPSHILPFLLERNCSGEHEDDGITVRQGRMNLIFENLDLGLFLDHEVALEESLVEVYNNLSGTCNGTYKRVAHEASLDEAFVFGSGAATNTTWGIVVSCLGCLEDEPLFEFLPANENGAESMGESLLEENRQGALPVAEEEEGAGHRALQNTQDASVVEEAFRVWLIAYLEKVREMLGSNELISISYGAVLSSNGVPLCTHSTTPADNPVPSSDTNPAPQAGPTSFAPPPPPSGSSQAPTVQSLEGTQPPAAEPVATPANDEGRGPGSALSDLASSWFSPSSVPVGGSGPAAGEGPTAEPTCDRFTDLGSLFGICARPPAPAALPFGTTEGPTTSSPTTAGPTVVPGSPSARPTSAKPTTAGPTVTPTSAPSTAGPTVKKGSPSRKPTKAPITTSPTPLPTVVPGAPSARPTTASPTKAPPTAAPSDRNATPTTVAPVTAQPTVKPGSPTRKPSAAPTSARPTPGPTVKPGSPSARPTTASPTTAGPTAKPGSPSARPTLSPTVKATPRPTPAPVPRPINSNPTISFTNPVTQPQQNPVPQPQPNPVSPPAPQPTSGNAPRQPTPIPSRPPSRPPATFAPADSQGAVPGCEPFVSCLLEDSGEKGAVMCIKNFGSSCQR